MIIYPVNALIITSNQTPFPLPCSTKVSRGVFVQEQDITLFRLSKKNIYICGGNKYL
jgi:hypothetical protein